MKARRTHIRHVCLTLLVASLWLEATQVLQACTCIAFDFAPDVDKFPIILPGKAVERSEHRASGPWPSPMIDVSFQVLQVWKGEVPTNVTIRTALQESACGYPFIAGRHYVVFIRRDLSPAGTSGWLLETNSCAPTQLAAKAVSLVAQLDAHFLKRTLVPEDVASSGAAQR